MESHFPNDLHYYSRDATSSVWLNFNQQRPWTFEPWSSLSTTTHNSPTSTSIFHTHPPNSKYLNVSNGICSNGIIFFQAKITQSSNSFGKVILPYFIIMLFYMLLSKRIKDLGYVHLFLFGILHQTKNGEIRLPLPAILKGD